MTTDVVAPTWLADWLANDAAGWMGNDPSVYLSAFAENAHYYTSAFSPPIEGRRAILNYIAGNLGEQVDVSYSYDVIAVQGRRAVVHWKASYVLPQQNIRQHLDGLSIYDFTADGQVEHHQEWTQMKDEALPLP